MAKRNALIAAIGILVLLWGFWKLVYPNFRFTYVELSSNFGDDISIVRPRFLIPREIRFAGIPLPGGDFYLIKDPHYFADRSSWITMPDKNGALVRLHLQGFEINYVFSKPGLHEEILAIEHDGKTYEYNIGEFNSRRYIDSKIAYALGFIDSKIILYLPAANTPNYGDGAFVKVSWPLIEETPERVVQSDPEVWEGVVQIFREAGISEELFADLCDVRLKPARAFAADLAGRECPPL